MTQSGPDGPPTTATAFEPHRGAHQVQELAPGTELMGMYRIVRRIAAGGFGITYLGEDNLGRKLAIKESFPLGMAIRDAEGMIHPVSEEAAPVWAKARSMFLREARVVADLKHPGVVHVQSLFEANGTAYMAMDYIDGSDLLELITVTHEGRLPEDVLMGVLRPLLDAIDFIHGAGVLHRDIKPNNIRVTPDGAPILIDFGAARRDSLTDGEMRAFSSFRVVADHYSPNEFYIAGVEVGRQSDLYSLAATLYFAISGGPPQPADARAVAVSNDLPDPYEPLTGRVEGYDPRLLSLVDAALRLRRVDRPADVAAWRDWLEAPHVEDAAGATDPSPPPGAAPPSTDLDGPPPVVAPDTTVLPDPVRQGPSGPETKVIPMPQPGHRPAGQDQTGQPDVPDPGAVTKLAEYGQSPTRAHHPAPPTRIARPSWRVRISEILAPKRPFGGTAEQKAYIRRGTIGWLVFGIWCVVGLAVLSVTLGFGAMGLTGLLVLMAVGAAVSVFVARR